MAAKKSTDVMIAGKVYTLSGYEEEGYLQHVASYINAKISEITEREEFRRIPNDMKSILIQLNIADDFFKAKNQYEAAEENYKKAEKDLFELKHELVDTQMKVEELLDKLNRERQERNQKSDRESQLEENYKRLEEKYQLLLSNAKVADERNRQFEEMLRLTQQEKREIEAVNKELRLNKEKLEATLADALLGASSPAVKKSDAPAGKRTSEKSVRPAAENDTGENKTSPAKKHSAESRIQTADDGKRLSAEHSGPDTDLEKTSSGDEDADRTEKPDTDGDQEGQELSAIGSEEFLTPAELSKEEVNELREAINETMAELSLEEQTAADRADAQSAQDQPADQADAGELSAENKSADDGKLAEKTSPADSEQRQNGINSTQEDHLPQEDTAKSSLPEQNDLPKASGPAETDHLTEEVSDQDQTAERLSDEETASSENGQQQNAFLQEDGLSQSGQAAGEDELPGDPSEEDPAQGLFVTSRNSIPLTPGLSEEELAELLGPIKEPQPVMAELSKEELEELLAPAVRHEITDEGPVPDPDEEDDYISSVMSEVSEDDDPEIQALARQIAELERQEQADKIKKKSKKNKKRKH